MSELLDLIQEADRVAFELETARANIEAAKTNLDVAKETFEQTRKSYEEMLNKADELGVPRNKIRKLMEERTLALVSSGLIVADAGTAASVSKSPKAAKVSKSPRKKTNIENENESIDFDTEETTTAVM